HLPNATAVPASSVCRRTRVRLGAGCRWSRNPRLNWALDRVASAREGSREPSSRFFAVPDCHGRACDRDGVAGRLRCRGSWLSWIPSGHFGIEGWWSTGNPVDRLGDGTWARSDTRIRVAHDALLFTRGYDAWDDGLSDQFDLAECRDPRCRHRRLLQPD